MKVEFFHDVICSFCFPMSYRMRKVAKDLNLEIIHRSYALARTPDDLIRMFGSKENAKKEILTHWDHANQNDDLHRFQMSKMRDSDFDFPYSMPGLLAAKAAKVIGGEDAYWEVFDAIQEALFVHAKDIANEQVIEDVVHNTSIDFDAWKQAYLDPATKQLIEDDFKLAQSYGIQSVPCLVVNGSYRIDGAQPYDVIVNALKSIQDKQLETVGSGDSCRMENGTIQCD